jgi:phosphonate transport system permease protein
VLVRNSARGLVIVSRAVPTLVFAVIFVRLFGLGPLAGGLAIAFHSVGMIAKLLTDAVEEANPLPSRAVRATGARSLQVTVATVWPQIVPTLVSVVLYRLDINIRASAILGIVGAGGIGVALQTAMGSLQYRRAAGIIVIIIALILVLELVSVTLRRSLGRRPANSDVAAASSRLEDPAWDRRRGGKAGLGLAALALFLFAVYDLGFNWERLRDALPAVQTMLSTSWPPAFSSAVFNGVFESLLLAGTGTVIGTVFGLVLALLTADGIAPVRALAPMLRVFVVVVRGIPDLVYALLFVAALGLGPFAGLMAMIISCTALAAKFFTDGLEQVDPTAHEAMLAVGASRSQAFIAGTWPQFVPAFVASTLFVVDLALRESIVLGVVGAGGIGFILAESVATLHYDVTSAILIAIVAVVVAIEAVSRFVRRRVL